MKQELNKYCLNHRMTYYEVFCKAYADFLGRPLQVGEYGKMHIASQEYIKLRDNPDPPHYVAFYLQKERRAVRHVLTTTSGM